jgi:putative Ca2+/H+ antiporter (TMEM165/GDT1 family)
MATFWTIFTTILVLEMGDKTQISGFTLAGQHGFWITLFGSAAALTVSSLLAVSFGSVFGKLPEKIVDLGGALIFLGFGGYYLVQWIIKYHLR